MYPILSKTAIEKYNGKCVTGVHVKYPVCRSDSKETRNLWTDFSKNSQYRILLNILRAAAEYFNADVRTGLTKLSAGLRDHPNAFLNKRTIKCNVLARTPVACRACKYVTHYRN